MLEESFGRCEHDEIRVTDTYTFTCPFVDETGTQLHGFVHVNFHIHGELSRVGKTCTHSLGNGFAYPPYRCRTGDFNARRYVLRRRGGSLNVVLSDTAPRPSSFDVTKVNTKLGCEFTCCGRRWASLRRSRGCTPRFAGSWGCFGCQRSGFRHVRRFGFWSMGRCRQDLWNLLAWCIDEPDDMAGF